MSRWYVVYQNKPRIEIPTPHVPYTYGFERRYSYSLDEPLCDQAMEAKHLAVEHYTNLASYLQALLTERA